MVYPSHQDTFSGLISGADIQRELRRRRKAHLEMSVRLGQEAEVAEDGWEIVRRNKLTIRIRKTKPHDQRLEDDTWTLLALMGFNDMNEGRNFRISIGGSSPNVSPKQIDVFAADDDTALVIECKSSEKLRRRSLQKDLNETRALQEGIRSTIHAHFPGRPRVRFVYVTRNIRWSTQDQERARDNQIWVVRGRQLDYYRRLVDIIGPAARHQLQADIFEGSPIPGLTTSVPALRGSFGSKTFYQFTIEPERLLKLAYVSHRSRIDPEAIGTYQRLLKKKRLRDIAEHINETGGVFPTNVVVNFRTRAGQRPLRFDSAGPSHDDPTSLGTLYLPNTYKSAWVIDGQHRLYGFSLSDWAERGKVPVLAFENLEPSEEIRMFVEINSKQVRVPRSLLIELEPESRPSNDEPQAVLSKLCSQIAMDLSESDDSPLWDHVALEWDRTDGDRKPITLPQLTSALAASQLLGTIRGGVLHPGFLFLRDTDTTLTRSRVAIEKFLALFAEGAPIHWAKKGRTAEAFLCTNAGIAALLRVFNETLKYVDDNSEKFEYERLTLDALVGSIVDLVAPIVDQFKAEDLNTRDFRGRYGSGAARAYAFGLMEIIHQSNIRFNPHGLAEYILEHSAESLNQAQALIREIEDSVRTMTFDTLKTKYGEEGNHWWREGVPQVVRGIAAQRAETSEDGGEAHQFLDLIDYKKIVEQSKHWRDFEHRFTVDRSARSKNDRLAWMDRLNVIRNRVSHSGRRYVTSEDISFLEEVWFHVDEQRNSLTSQLMS